MWLLGTPATFKCPGDVIYIAHQVYSAVTSRYPLFCEGTGVTGHSQPATICWPFDTALQKPPVRPVHCTGGAPVQPVLKGSVFTPLQLTWHCTGALLRCLIGSSCAEDLLHGRLTSSLKDSMVIAPVLHISCHQCIRCYCDLLTWPPYTLSNAPVPLHRFIRWPPVRPMLGHRLNRCYCLCILCSNRRCGHLDISNIFYLYFFTATCHLNGGLDTSLRWIGHIGFYPWDLKIL